MTTLQTASSVATATQETLTASLVTVIQKATQGVEAGVGFLSVQLPDVVHQLLMWKAVESGILAALLIISAITSVVFAIKFVGKWKEAYIVERKNTRGWADPSGYIVLQTISFIIAALLSMAAVSRFMIVLKIVIAPKVYLITYAAELLK